MKDRRFTQKFNTFQELKESMNPAENNTRKEDHRESEEQHVYNAMQMNQERLRLTARYLLQQFGRGEMDGLDELL
jgi:hypothetical protein